MGNRSAQGWLPKADRLALELRKHRRLLEMHLERQNHTPSGRKALARAQTLVRDLEAKLAAQREKDAAAAKEEARLIRRGA